MSKKEVIFNNEAANKHRELTNAIKANLTREGAHFTEKESHASYNANLPEGLTPDLVKSLSKYNGQHLKASSVAVLELAAEAFLEDKSLETVTANVGFQAPGDSFKFSVDRQREFPVPRKEGEDKSQPQRKVTKHLHLERTVEISGQSVKSVTSPISEEFANRFAS